MNNQSGSAGTESTQDYFIIVGQLKIQPSSISQIEFLYIFIPCIKNHLMKIWQCMD